MRAILIVVCLVAAAGVAATRYLEDYAGKAGDPMAPAANTSAAPHAENSAGSRTVTLQRDGRGHFQVDARVDGRRISFMVDTGASSIALRVSEAARLGIHPKPSDYTIRTQTANGTGRAAPVQLHRVEVNGITVRDVQAVVVPDEALGENLLGMSFLSRVKWSYDRGRLVLEQ
jgi:aspartyl protease family protein